jgi:serine/threonine-protein phosphatase 2A activator
LYEYLETLDKWVDEIPPIHQPMRFGNKSFRTWQDKVIQVSEISYLFYNVDSMLEAIVPIKEAIPELKVYLTESFGSYERIDYGTGHELNFVVFLLCLVKLQVYKQEDFKALINKVF